MTLDQQTLALFYPFNRETSRGRHLIYDMNGFVKYVEENSGRDDVYVSTYPVSKNQATGQHEVTEVDRVVFELDGDLAIRDGKRLYLWGVNNGFPTIPIASGRKGIHIHILSRTIRVANAKEVLTDISTYILNQALGIQSWDEDMSIDWTIFGNTSSLIRVPGTLRTPDNNSYCTFLPPSFPEMSEEEIYHHTKAPHVYNYRMSRSKSLLDLPFTVDVETIKAESVFEPISIPKVSSLFKTDDSGKFLSNLLSPRRLAQISQQNPPHQTRIVTTLELLDCGIVPEELIKLYAGLGWHDYNEAITRNYVNDLARRYYNGDYKVRRPD
jgi:hypothetical protein